MKTYIYLILVLTLSLSTTQSKAQEIFLGTWEHRSGNEIFRVFLFENLTYENEIHGHYEKVQINNGTETYIYSSDKNKFVGNNQRPSLTTIMASGNNESISGLFEDNTVDENLYSQLKSGHIDIIIISNSGGRNPVITAKWKVERPSYQGVTVNEAPGFSVPVDIILTKVN